MSKKRKTKEQKIRSRKRHEKITGQSNSDPYAFTLVKREFNSSSLSGSPFISTNNKQEKTNQTSFLASNLNDLLKTVILASIIFGLEAMLYFAWK